jgi:2-polyprenyl-3-methyl-5-hydroxy-6-metoxy-1,4-benzoquinol methylase
MNTNLVVSGYNQLADRYWREREQLGSGKYLNKLIEKLKMGSRILDLGCGDGIPVDRQLIKKGFLVTGLDISEKMIERARKNCPRGDFQVKNMLDLINGEYEVEAVVSMYAIFHIPRDKHRELLLVINSFLPIGGLLLITMGDKDFEGEHEAYNVPMWSSHFGPKKNLEMVMNAGFEVVINEIDFTGGEKHQFLLGQKW